MLFGRTDSEAKPAIPTPWSLVHFTAGAASMEYANFWVAEFVHLLYEKIGSKRIFNSVGFNIQDASSLENSLGDQAIFTLGRALPRSKAWLPVTAGIAFLFVKHRIEF